MCPTCPDCCNGDEPRMNMYGSNATPMGGSLGRVDAAVGAVEAQKAEWVLHLHMFLFLQMAQQYSTLAQIAEQIRQGLLSATSFKHLLSVARCAAYPHNNLFKEERASIDRAWPAFAADTSYLVHPLGFTMTSSFVPYLHKTTPLRKAKFGKHNTRSVCSARCHAWTITFTLSATEKMAWKLETADPCHRARQKQNQRYAEVTFRFTTRRQKYPTVVSRTVPGKHNSTHSCLSTTSIRVHNYIHIYIYIYMYIYIYIYTFIHIDMFKSIHVCLIQ